MTEIKQSGLNCWATCIACLLDLQEEDVPDFCNIEPVEDWFKRTVDWLMERGLGIILIDLCEQDLPDSIVRARAEWIVTGEPVDNCGCERRARHAVIYHGADLWWDTHQCFERKEGGLKPGTLIDGAVIFPLRAALAATEEGPDE